MRDQESKEKEEYQETTQPKWLRLYINIMKLEEGRGSSGAGEVEGKGAGYDSQENCNRFL